MKNYLAYWAVLLLGLLVPELAIRGPRTVEVFTYADYIFLIFVLILPFMCIAEELRKKKK